MCVKAFCLGGFLRAAMGTDTLPPILFTQRIPFSLTYLPSPCLFPSTGDTRLGGQAVGESEAGARAAEGH